MKKLLLFTLLLTGLYRSEAQTTQQEYNYCRNGLLQDVFSGRNILRGYSLQKFYTSNDDNQPVQVRLFNNRLNKTQAILMIVHSGDIKQRVVVVPIKGSQAMWNQTYSDVNYITRNDIVLGVSLSYQFAYLLSQLSLRLDIAESRR